MDFWSVITICASIGIFGFLICIFIICCGTLNKEEEEAYRKGYNDGVNSIKKEK